MRNHPKVAACRAFLVITTVVLVAAPVGIVEGQETADTMVLGLKTRVRSTSPLLAARRAALELARTRSVATGHLAPAVLSAEVEDIPSFANVTAAQSMRVDISRELLPGGQRRAERTLANLDVERATIEMAVAEQLIDAAVDALVVQSAGHAAIAARLASEDSVLQGAEDAVRARFAVADARYVDVLRLRTERLRVGTERRAAAAEYAVARGQLLRLALPTDSVGLTALVDAAVTEVALRILAAAPISLPPIDSQWTAAAARQLLAIDVRRAQAGITVARATGRPTLAPTFGVQRFGDGNESSRFGLVAGLSVSLPFTARAANRSRLAAAERALVFAQLQHTAIESRLASRLAVAADRFAVARAQLASYDATLLRGAREERETALASYRAGSVTLIELLDFERALAQAEVSRIRTRIAAAEALVAYLTAALTVPEAGDLR